ncbi:MAG: FeoA family protein [Sphingomonas oligoaromativorans]|uniref:FeoA family protein n=1 Tax=Sphingomonas oligoaromativorans TaxID=575322 RepID=UPI00141F1EDA|nr:FeoA family protein [Sphingomonas oligoaromativorans]NIJ32932.1 ferrous iron transport protein A [Sphingomonas oligoaromativorans]
MQGSFSVEIGFVPVRLDQLPLNRPARVLAIAWADLADTAAKRLRELGFDEGVTVEAVHVSPFGKDPIACRVGRMTVALRRAQAQAISVEAIAA